MKMYFHVKWYSVYGDLSLEKGGTKSLKRKWVIRFKFKVFKVRSGVAVFAPPLFDT